MNFYGVVEPIVQLINSFVGPLIAVVAAVGGVYCILLGVKYARAEEPQDREKAKQHLKGAIIGFLLIFILLVALYLLKDPMIQWVSQQTGSQYAGITQAANVGSGAATGTNG